MERYSDDSQRVPQEPAGFPSLVLAEEVNVGSATQQKTQKSAKDSGSTSGDGEVIADLCRLFHYHEIILILSEWLTFCMQCLWKSNVL